MYLGSNTRQKTEREREEHLVLLRIVVLTYLLGQLFYLDFYFLFLVHNWRAQSASGVNHRRFDVANVCNNIEK